MTVTQKQVQDKFQEWNMSLATGYQIYSVNKESYVEPHTVASVVTDQYDFYGILFATKSGKYRDERAMITDYFNHFVQNKPVGTIVQENIITSDKFGIQGGTYNFHLTDYETKEESDVLCDFTFVSKLGEDGKLKFIHHHSSMKAHAADDPVLDDLMHDFKRAYGHEIRAGLTNFQSPRGVCASTFEDSLKESNEKSNKSGNNIAMTQQAFVALDDGCVLHCGHLNVSTAEGEGFREVGHRFTLIFNKFGQCVCQQISKNPEKPEGVLIKPALAAKMTGTAPQPELANK